MIFALVLIGLMGLPKLRSGPSGICSSTITAREYLTSREGDWSPVVSDEHASS